MSTSFLPYILAMIGLNVLCTYIYRHGGLTSRSFQVTMMLANAIGVFVGLLTVGFPYTNWVMLSIFTLSGLLLGFQGSKVIINIGQMEASGRNNQKEKEQ